MGNSITSTELTAAFKKKHPNLITRFQRLSIGSITDEELQAIIDFDLALEKMPEVLWSKGDRLNQCLNEQQRRIDLARAKRNEVISIVTLIVTLLTLAVTLG